MTEHTVIHTIFFFNDTATTEIYTLSLHDALPISMDLARRHPEFTLSVLFVDIRGLNVFNETMGRAVVDQLIIDISNRLKARLRHDDTISRSTPTGGPGQLEGNETLARMDGDQFTVLLEGIKGPS